MSENNKDNQLRLVNGKFMRGNEEVPIKIGDPEQIRLVKQLERELDDIEKQARMGQLPVDVSISDIRYSMKCSFKCSCGRIISEIDNYCFADSLDDFDDLYWEYGDITCPKCGKTYHISSTAWGYVAKLVEN